MWALYAIIILVILIVAVLCVPVDFIFKLHTAEFHKRKFQFNCFWGLLRLDLRKTGKDGKSGTADKTGRKKKRLGAGTIFDILLVRGALGKIGRLLRHAFRHSHIRHLAADIFIGPEDPVHFGYLYAFLIPVNYWLSKTPHRIAINPVFDGQMELVCAAEGEVRAYPIMLLGGALAFTFSRPGFEVLRILRKQWK